MKSAHLPANAPPRYAAWFRIRGFGLPFLLLCGGFLALAGESRLALAAEKDGEDI